MRRLEKRPARGLIGLWLALMATSASSTEFFGPIDWRSDYAKALAEARATGKILLVNIHTTWCGPCRQLQATTLRDPALGGSIGEHCIPLSLDGDEHADLIEQWNVSGFPTQVFLSPDGKVLGRITGFVTPIDYGSHLRQAVTQHGLTMPKLDQFARRPKPTELSEDTLVLRRPQVETQVELDPPKIDPFRKTTRPLVQMPTPRADGPLADFDECRQDAPLALDGFSPVSMIQRAELVVGRSEECLVYRGSRYLFISSKEREAFLKEPFRFLPAEDGKCVVTWAEEGRWTRGATKYPAIFNDQVFLFPSEEHRKKFLLDPDRYVAPDGRARTTQVRKDDAGTSIRR